MRALTPWLTRKHTSWQSPRHRISSFESGGAYGGGGLQHGQAHSAVVQRRGEARVHQRLRLWLGGAAVELPAGSWSSAVSRTSSN